MQMTVVVIDQGVAVTAITTAELLQELGYRMDRQQNSIKGEELSKLCYEALVNLDAGVLKQTRWG